MLVVQSRKNLPTTSSFLMLHTPFRKARNDFHQKDENSVTSFSNTRTRNCGNTTHAVRNPTGLHQRPGEDTCQFKQ